MPYQMQWILFTKSLHNNGAMLFNSVPYYDENIHILWSETGIYQFGIHE